MKGKKVEINYPYSLEVEEGGGGTELIGSEIPPELIGTKREDEFWDNGPTIYHRWDLYEYWLVVQHGQPIIIKKFSQWGNFADEKPYWEAYHLEETLQVDRWLPEE